MSFSPLLLPFQWRTGKFHVASPFPLNKHLEWPLVLASIAASTTKSRRYETIEAFYVQEQPLLIYAILIHSYGFK